MSWEGAGEGTVLDPAVMNFVLLLHITGPPNQHSKTSKGKKKDTFR